jgi:hypothetical protein
MPEEVKKIILLCVSLPDRVQVYEGAKGKKLPGFGSLVDRGTWASRLFSPSPAAAMLATLTTGASPETHGVRQSGDLCRAEYIWEASLRSSKKTSLFGFSVDRPPSGQILTGIFVWRSWMKRRERYPKSKHKRSMRQLPRS